ncbi:MAG: hypothetical protein ACLTJG_15565 [[Clostridium] innocuum]
MVYNVFVKTKGGDEMLPEKKKELMRPVVETVNKLPEDGQKVFEIAAMAYLLGREQGRVKESPRLNTAAAR